MIFSNRFWLVGFAGRLNRQTYFLQIAIDELGLLSFFIYYAT